MKRSIDGKAILVIEVQTNENVPRNLDTEDNIAFLNKFNSIVDKKWMDKEELNEKHLVAAIKTKEPIPTPDVITIDEEIYEKLYPANFKKHTWRIINEPLDDIVEYDMDSEDHQFLQSQSTSFTVTAEKFEKHMEFLEENSKMQVPTFDQLKSAFYSHGSLHDLEKVYDYWLEKRLMRGGKKLKFTLKSDDKCIKKGKKHDPYVAFRPCHQKTLLRKNRKLERENYLKMLEIRATMLNNVNKCREELLKKRLQHETLKKKFKMFENAYLTRDYNEQLNSQEPFIDTGLMLNFNRKPKDEVAVMSVDKSKQINIESLSKFDFQRKAGTQFHAPVHNNVSDDEDDAKKYMYTNRGLIRHRMGRGGRMVIDRKEINPTTRPIPPADYFEINLNGKLCVKKYNFFDFNVEKDVTSSFRLKSSSSSIVKASLDINNNNNDEVHLTHQICYKMN